MKYKVSTLKGDFIIETYEREAPVSSRNFQTYVENGFLNPCAIERVLTPENDTNPHCKISVVQWGIRDPKKILPPIEHEPTSQTGLSHCDGTVSLARPPNGTGQCIFFICIGNQPSLDYGGPRYADKLGFAAFGHVVGGMDVVRAIYALAQDGDYLSQPLPIFTVVPI